MPDCPHCRRSVPRLQLLLARNPLSIDCPACRTPLRISGPALQACVATCAAGLAMGAWMGLTYLQNDLPPARAALLVLGFGLLVLLSQLVALTGRGCLVRRATRPGEPCPAESPARSRRR